MKKNSVVFFMLLLCNFSFSVAQEPLIRYKMYCLYTPDFENLFQNYFFPSLKDDFELVVKVYPQDCPSGEFRSAGWNKTMLKKLELLRMAILENWDNQVFFYSDIDIIFLKPILDISLKHLGDLDFVVQQSWPRDRLCAGFFVMRGNDKTLQVVSEAYELLSNEIYPDDQLALEAVLEDNKLCTWKLLPSEQYPNGRRILKETTGYYQKNSEIVLHDSMILFHATGCVGLENKCHFLRRVQEKIDTLP